MTEVRTRTRAIVTEGAAAVTGPGAGHNSKARPTKEMKELAEQFFIVNVAANKARSEADGKRKTLFKMMEDAALADFAHTFKIGDQPVTVDVVVDTPEDTYIDVAVLKTLVKPDVFMKIIAATKKSVETHAGTNIAVQAEKTKPGTRNVNVKARKG